MASLKQLRYLPVSHANGGHFVASIAEASAVPSRHAKTRPTFYLWMGIAFCALTFFGFYRSFYLNHWFATPPGMRTLTPFFIAHGSLFTLWLMFSVLQPAMIVRRHRKLHKRIGWFAVGVAALMVIVGNMASAEAMNHGFAGLGDRKVFYAVPFFDMVVFGTCIALAVRWRNHSDWHKRLVLLSYTQILHAGVSRYPFAWLLPWAPWSFTVWPDLMIILPGVAYDLARRGRVHKVWWLGGGIVLASEPLRVLIGLTAPWYAFASWIASLWPN